MLFLHYPIGTQPSSTVPQTSTEKVFNLFLFENAGLIREFGAVFHKVSGTDVQKQEFLKSKVLSDVTSARRFPIPKDYLKFNPIKGASVEGLLSAETFRQLREMDMHLAVFEAAFKVMNAPRQPLWCLTFVVDGEVRQGLQGAA